MKKSRQTVKLLDYRQAQASNDFVPQPARLSSLGRWNDIHFELHQQPQFETLEHQHTMHVIALGFSNSPQEKCSPGERWLDGRIQKERRNPGDIAVIPAGISHRCNWNSLAKYGILAIEPILLEEVGQDLVDDKRIEIIPKFMDRQDELIEGIFLSMEEELKSPKIADSLFIDSLKTTLAIHLLRKYCTIKPKFLNYQDSLSKSKFKQVTEYINEHLDTDLKITELAEIAHLSPCYFIRLFKNTTGQTPHQYILHQRIQKARYLLQQKNITISKIAATVGFCDQSHFTKYFKRNFGVTPREYIARSQ